MSFWKAFKLLLTLHCEESSRLLSEGFERDLSLVEWWAVRLHFLSCKACRRFHRQLSFLQEAARQHQEKSRDAKLSGDLQDRIRRDLNSQVDPAAR